MNNQLKEKIEELNLEYMRLVIKVHVLAITLNYDNHDTSNSYCHDMNCPKKLEQAIYELCNAHNTLELFVTGINLIRPNTIKFNSVKYCGDLIGLLHTIYCDINNPAFLLDSHLLTELHIVQ